LFAKAGEETALDGSRKALVPGAQLGESVVQIEEPLGLGITTDTLLVEGHGHHPSAALRRETSARTAYDHLAHGAGCDSEKVASVFHTHAFLVRELEIGFVDEIRRVERCSSVGTAKMVARDAAKLVIDERHELIEGLAISACIGLKKIGDGSVSVMSVTVEAPRISRERQLSQELGPTAIIRACYTQSCS
jgi:hypothetical protein